MIQKSKVKFVERELYPQILKWLHEPEIIAINGSRQTGKTTLLLKLKEQLKGERIVYVNFEDMDQLESFTHSPKDVVSLQLGKSGKTYFLFDEFHYVGNAGKILKLLFDQFPQAKFIISGSSSLRIREIAAYLVGRIVFLTLHPFSFSEYLSYYDKTLFALWQKFNHLFWDFLDDKRLKLSTLIFESQLKSGFADYLTFGGYPAVATSVIDLKKERLNGLIETYIEKDIIRYLQIGNFLEFKNMTKILSSQIGSLINYSSLSSDLQLSNATVKKFLAALENTFIIKLVPPFFSNRVTEIKKSPKNFFQDLGLRNALISDFREIDFRQDKGAVVENFVFQNLSYRKETSQLSFWRTKQGAEVDFVLRYKNEIIPAEVKYQEARQPRLTRSFLSFLNIYKPAKAIVLTKNYNALIKHRQTKVLFLPIYFV
ncbi:ATP-binding protein [Candidatus Gottesmanbacteria bacterium]|nr:ATP-binding protein [Candidatus Gottesmanbacteria bacterium]